MTAAARHAIRVLARRCADPGEVLAGTNEILIADELALLRADGRVRMLGGGGLPLGLFPDAEPATQDLTMDPGDLLFLYTTGVAQLRGAGNTEFQDRLADELVGLAGSAPDRLVASMRQALPDFSDGNLVDDVTMLAMRALRRARGSRSAARTGAGDPSRGPAG